MTLPPAHRARADWREALEISEAVYRLALPLAAAAPRLSEQLTAAVAALPPAVALRKPEEALLQLETLLLLATRLQALPEAKTTALIARLDRLRAAPTAPPAAPPKPAVPAPPPARADNPTAKPSPSPPPRVAAVPPPSPPDRLLVDGSNYLGRAPGYALGDESSKDRLLFRLQDYLRGHPAHKVTAFFDGQKTAARNVGGVEERITSGLHNADDVIVDTVRALPGAERKRCTVVTDDRGLAARVRNEGARVESVAWLTGRLVAPAAGASTAHSAGLSRSELSEWEDFFKKPPQRPGK